MADRRKVLTLTGLGLIGAGVVMAASTGPSAAPAPSPKPSPQPTPAPKPQHLSIGAWIAANKARPDIAGGIAGRQWEAILGQYLREQWADFLARPDIAGGLRYGAWSEVEGEWIAESNGAFWHRADVVAAWYAVPAGILGPNPYDGIAVRADTSSKASVIGQFLIENGILR